MSSLGETVWCTVSNSNPKSLMVFNQQSEHSGSLFQCLSDFFLKRTLAEDLGSF